MCKCDCGKEVAVDHGRMIYDAVYSRGGKRRPRRKERFYEKKLQRGSENRLLKCILYGDTWKIWFGRGNSALSYNRQLEKLMATDSQRV